MSVGADAQQLLAAQQAAAKGTKSPEKSQAPLPAIPPISIEKPTPPPPPPAPPAVAEAPVVNSPPPPPPPLAPSVPDTDAPPRPSFKEPPPEDDDLPPRPTFKDPPPEPEDVATPPMPKFADPPPEPESPALQAPTTPPPAPPATSVTPPTPSAGSKRGSPSPTKLTSRSPSPAISDAAKSPISRTGSAGVRGPRIARGPRAPGGGSVSSMVSNLNRNSGTVSPTPITPTSPSYKRLSGSPSRRPSSVVGRTAAFSRRTMASDAEDDVVDKK